MKNLIKLLIIRLIVNLADSVFYIVALWHVSNNYSSSMFLGIFIAVNYLPDLLLIFFGPVIDRVNPQKILIISILVQLAVAVIFLLLLNQISFWVIMSLVFISVMASSISYVIEDVLIPQVVEYDKIVFANSLFSISYKVLDSIFNSFASFLQVAVGFILLVKIDIGIFLLALFILLLLKFRTSNANIENFSFKYYKREVLQGTKFILNNKLLFKTSISLTLINFFYSFQTVVVPIFSIRYFDGPIFYGIFLTIAGLGGILGNMLAPIVIKYLKSNQIVGVFLFLNGSSWLVAIVIKDYTLSLILFFVCFMSKGVFNIIFNSLYQQIPPQQLLGRVNTTIDSIISFGMPIGSLVAGTLIDLNIELVLIAISIPYFLFSYIFYTDNGLKEFSIY
ncbi:Permease [Streptococcus pneumoniae]|uniref:MFS transporter n=1 Tax=Streptococcus pneumoniae TaxID=1313 RepID=UPI0007656DD9|nr:MFS transporter [Streptococcus pneumoniae]OZS34607.1 MFS transporter [Streptococcus pneumoniae]CVL33331.1 Permease [Streptococcus pneumoniae]CVM82472.1 Permease [Streptococcus pneumoniae]CVM87427.1 Permease [Streptococcus pneumoniae]CVR62669.1 Permease [Streptococcus pneumoniae]